MNKFICGGCLGFLLNMSAVMAKEVRVNIEDIEIKRSGNIMLLVFSEAGFPKEHEQALQVITVKADAEKISLSFTTDLEELALKVLHDEDENGKVSKNWTGIFPAEGLGFSNAQKIGLTGPPGYKKSKVVIGEQGAEFSIRLRYP